MSCLSLFKIATAARELCDKAEIIIVSRGKKGAVAVTKDVAIQGELVDAGEEAINTVGCGDYLLAGFLDGFSKKSNIAFALERGIKAATGRALGLSAKKSWADVESQIRVKTGACP